MSINPRNLWTQANGLSFLRLFKLNIRVQEKVCFGFFA